MKIGRASCRGRGEISGGAGSLKKKRGNRSCSGDWSSDVCSSDLFLAVGREAAVDGEHGRVGLVKIHEGHEDRKSTRLNSSHGYNSYPVFCLNFLKFYKLFFNLNNFILLEQQGVFSFHKQQIFLLHISYFSFFDSFFLPYARP